MSRRPHEYLLSLGSNIEPARWVPRALALLRARFGAIQVSPRYDVPAEGAADQPRFVNLAVRIATDLPPTALREVCRSMEALCGRVRTKDRYAPRTLDLDVVYSASPWPPEDRLPDPELSEVAYVLVPGAVIWPEARDPRSGRTLRAAAEARFPDWDAAHRLPEED